MTYTAVARAKLFGNRHSRVASRRASGSDYHVVGIKVRIASSIASDIYNLFKRQELFEPMLGKRRRRWDLNLDILQSYKLNTKLPWRLESRPTNRSYLRIISTSLSRGWNLQYAFFHCRSPLKLEIRVTTRAIALG